MKEFIIKVYKKFSRFIKFGTVGLINTGVTLATYYLLIALGVNHIIANVIGYIVGSINGYILSKVWVFKDKKASVKESVWKYYIIYGSSLLLSTALMYLWVDVLGISDKIAPLLCLVFTVPYNFIFQKLWAFRDKDNVQHGQQEKDQK
jgi:putative flippase GtrA